MKTLILFLLLSIPLLAQDSTKVIKAEYQKQLSIVKENKRWLEEKYKEQINIEAFLTERIRSLSDTTKTKVVK